MDTSQPLHVRIEWASRELARLAAINPGAETAQEEGPALVARIAAEANLNQEDFLILWNGLAPDAKKALMRQP